MGFHHRVKLTVHKKKLPFFSCCFVQMEQLDAVLRRSIRAAVGGDDIYT